MTDITQLDPEFAPIEADADCVWHDARDIGIGGKGWTDTLDPYYRFPERARHATIPGAYSLAKCSAGLYVRFTADTGRICCKWTTRFWGTTGSHMNGLCLSGVDLYARDRGKLRFVGIGAPQRRIDNTALLCDLPMPPPGSPREYCLYLPLYNGVTDVQIGLPRGAKLAPAPLWPGVSRTGKPILIYGTSITQGGCTARPGMNYTSIIQRMLDRDVINLGFSGNGPYYREIIPLLAEIDASVYVLDAIANSTIQSVRNETFECVTKLRELRPGVPIVMPEAAQSSTLVDGQRHKGNCLKNQGFREQVARLLDAGVADLHFVPMETLTDPNCEGTVDGGHPNDIGFLHLAQTIGPVLRGLG